MKKFLSISAFALLLASALSFTNTTYAQRFDKLGERKVNFKSDRDVISGIGDGFFNALKLKVTGGSISIQKMVIHFRNGTKTEVALRENFTDGSESRVIDLPGKRRLIEKVVFWYEANSSALGNKPVVELWGRHY